MCTVIIALQHFAAAPVVVAANRDEVYARPTRAGALLEPGIVGGLDLAGGGTWMGMNARGLLVALTNLGPTAGGRRSRGELVLELLRMRDPDNARAHLEATDLAAFTAFNLAVVDQRGGFTVHAPDGQAEIAPLQPGITVVVSGGPPDDPDQPKVARARDLVRQIPSGFDDRAGLRDALLGALADRQPAPHARVDAWREPSGTPLEDFRDELQRIWVRTPFYGTRSSSVALLGDEPRYWYVEGDPASGPDGPPTPLTPLLEPR